MKIKNLTSRTLEKGTTVGVNVYLRPGATLEVTPNVYREISNWISKGWVEVVADKKKDKEKSDSGFFPRRSDFDD